MFLVLFIFVTLSACLIISYRTKFAYIMSLYFIGCIGSMLSGFFYHLAMSSYIYTGTLDYYFFVALTRLRVTMQQASLIQMVGICFFMMPAIFCLNLVRPEVKLWNKILLVLPILYVLCVNLPAVDWSLYLSMNKPGGNNAWIRVLAEFFRWSSVLLVAVYLLAPIPLFAQYVTATKIFVKKRYGISCIVCISLVYVILFLLFIIGVFSDIMFYNVDLINFPAVKLGMYGEQGNIMVSVFLILVINIYILLYFKPFQKTGADSRRRFVRRSRAVGENVYMLLHIYKNRFLGIEKLASMNVQQADSAKAMCRTLTMIEKEAKDSVENISKTLKMLNVITSDYRVFLLEHCLDEALRIVAMPESITLKKDYFGKKTVILGDRNHIVEAFVNLLRNGIEAIEQKGNQNGRIEIEIYSESDMVCVRLRDNGCGIPAKDMKRIFKVFYTTKSQKVGNGLGLDFVRRVIGIHGGDMRMESVEGMYTCASVVLPVYRLKKEYSK